MSCGGQKRTFGFSTGDAPMATNLDLDDKLIDAARRLGGHRTKRDAVTRALEEYVRWLRQPSSTSLAGSTMTRGSTTRNNAAWRESSCRYVGLVARPSASIPASRRVDRR